MVIWDEPRVDVFHRLEVNGIDQARAQHLYHKARSERIAIIRADAIRRAAGGLGLLLAGAGIFVVFWDGFGGITRLLFCMCAVAAGFGTWLLFKGLFGFLCAPWVKA